MSWIGSTLKAVGGFFTGNTGGKAIQALDELHLSAEERQNIDQKDLESARNMQIASGNTGFDILVNCIARLVRPIITLWLFGGLAGFWDFPDIDRVPPFHQSLIYLCGTFWFGGRAITKDLPILIKALKT